MNKVKRIAIGAAATGILLASALPAFAGGPSPLPSQPTATPVSLATATGDCADTSITVTLGGELESGTFTVDCP